MDLKDAYSKIISDKELAKRYTENPRQVLQELGVDTSALKISTVTRDEAQITDVASEKDLELVDTSICGSIGCVGCISVGS